MKYLVYVLSAVACLFLLIPSARAQGDEDKISRFIRIPVYFVTDRNLLPNKDCSKVEFGHDRQYEFGACQHDPYVGLAYCVIRNTEKKPDCTSWKGLGWERSSRLVEGPDGTSLTCGKTYKDKVDSFYHDIYKRADESNDHELFVFAPGYMSTFESGLRSAARLSYYAERPIVLYSWPSKGKFTEYFSDEATVEWSQEHFDDMLGHMATLADQTPPVHVRIYAHSMGGRLILRATPYLKNNKAVVEVSVVCPDVDDGLVKHYAAKYFDGNQPVIVRLYESKRDEMLKLSQLVHGGYKRFGEDRKPIDSLWPKGTNASMTKEGVGDIGSDDPAQCAMTKILRRIQTIDYTDIDVGTLGHRIPVEVLASLSQRGCPGAGLTMCVSRRPSKAVEVVQDTAVKTKNDSKDDSAKVTTADASSKAGLTGAVSTETTNSTAKLPLTSRTNASGGTDGVIFIEKTRHLPSVPVVSTLIKYRPRLRLLITKDWSLK